MQLILSQVCVCAATVAKLRNALGQNGNYSFPGGLLTTGRESLVTIQICKGQSKVVIVFVRTGFVVLTVSQINPFDNQYVSSLQDTF